MKYNALRPDAREIRLLTLLPSKYHNEPLRCSINTVSMDNDPDFWALSYVWGDESITSDIIIDTTAIPVTTNLAAALQHIRSVFGQVVIWVDAACINQSDNVEKNTQVQLMSSIYTKAAKVIGWLGSEENNSALVFAILRSIDRAKKDHILRMSTEGRWDDVTRATQPGGVSSNASWLAEIPQLTRKLRHRGSIWSLGLLLKQLDWRHIIWLLSPGFSLSPAWTAIQYLFQHAYWTRIWILQEFVLSTKLLLMCGLETIEPELIPEILNVFHLTEMGDKPKDMDFTAQSIFMLNTEWKSAYATTTLRLLPPDERHLGNLVARFYVLGSTNPRDRIYGLLGISNDKIEPRYDKSVEEVYVQFAAKWITEYKTADIVVHAEFNALGARTTDMKKPTLPSWVPDWDDLYAVHQLHPMLKSTTSSSLFSKSTASARPFSWHLTPQNNLLAPGIRVDEIATLGPTLDTAFVAEAAVEDFCRAYIASDFPGSFDPDDQASSWTPRYITGISKSRALFHLFLLNTDLLTDRPLDPSSHTYAALAFAFATYFIDREGDEEMEDRMTRMAISLATPYLKAYEAQKTHGGALALLLGLLDDSAEDEDENPLPRELLDAVLDARKVLNSNMVWSWVRKRRIFETGRGYLGVGPADMTAGDVLVVLDGCNMPAVLRRVGEGWFFLGLAFVVGLMEGEVEEMLEKGKVEVDEFGIC
jgi:hypothetical protein